MIRRYCYACALVPAAFALGLTGCGSAGDAAVSAAADTVPTAAAATGVRVNTGPISGFGSVFVNGVEYDTHHAEIEVDGAPRLEDDLRVGMIVRITGTINPDGVTGNAQKIEFRDNVQGTVDRVDPAGNSLVVLGQPVVTDDLTAFEGTALSAMVPGNVVEVSGLVDAAGTIHATHIELKTIALVPGDLQELKGVITNLDDKTKTFTVQGQAVSYAAADVTALPDGPADGLSVEVQSTRPGNRDGTLAASTVRPFEQAVHSTVPQGVRLEGLVTSYTSPGEFKVGAQPVITAPGTRYRNGRAADLAVNARVEVQGTVGADGLLHAAEVKIQSAGLVEIDSEVEAVRGGMVTLLGIPVALAADTQYRDAGPSRLHHFCVRDMSVGDRVDVRGYRKDGTVTATALERRAPVSPPQVIMNAPVDAVRAPALTVLGVTVTTDATTLFSSHGAALAADDFFAAVQAGAAVRITGTSSGDGTIAARRIEATL